MMNMPVRVGWVLAIALSFFHVPAHAANTSVYDTHCALCHQRGAVGLQGQFPRLAGRVDVMANTAQARAYLIKSVLFGLSGKIEVDGASIIGVMPAFASLSDKEIAEVFNYLIGLAGKPAKSVATLTPAEVEAVRKGPRFTTSELTALRRELVSAKVIP